MPCYHGSCAEIYRENAFEASKYRQIRPLSVSRDLGDTSIMLLVHPTLTDTEIDKTCDVLQEVLSLASN